jgi:hypothetical protein
MAALAGKGMLIFAEAWPKNEVIACGLRLVHDKPNIDSRPAISAPSLLGNF